jgi:hypothetical protein
MGAQVSVRREERKGIEKNVVCFLFFERLRGSFEGIFV